MNWDRIEGNWKQFSGQVKSQWSRLTDDDISFIDGKREELEGKIQARYGYAKDQAKREVDDWLSRNGYYDDPVAARAREFADATEERYSSTLAAIRREPLKGVAIAAGIGFVAALVLGR
jgi:uncharacterized protein YjbJ (UPF0337 family)